MWKNFVSFVSISERLGPIRCLGGFHLTSWRGGFRLFVRKSIQLECYKFCTQFSDLLRHVYVVRWLYSVGQPDLTESNAILCENSLSLNLTLGYVFSGRQSWCCCCWKCWIHLIRLNTQTESTHNCITEYNYWKIVIQFINIKYELDLHCLSCTCSRFSSASILLSLFSSFLFQIDFSLCFFSFSCMLVSSMLVA